jgi:hypothetical protein
MIAFLNQILGPSYMKSGNNQIFKRNNFPQNQGSQQKQQFSSKSRIATNLFQWIDGFRASRTFVQGTTEHGR